MTHNQFSLGQNVNKKSAQVKVDDIPQCQNLLIASASTLIYRINSMNKLIIVMCLCFLSVPTQVYKFPENYQTGKADRKT